jgi:hypothetical protein
MCIEREREREREVSREENWFVCACVESTHVLLKLVCNFVEVHHFVN